MTDKQLAEAMRAARKSGGFALEDLAGPLGFRIGSLSRWETLKNEEEPDRGTKILHYFVALLRSRPEVRDRLLREIGALKGTLAENDAEIARRMDLVRRAYASDNGYVRTILGSLEYALREAAGESDRGPVDVKPRASPGDQRAASS